MYPTFFLTYIHILSHILFHYNELTHWKRPCCWERLRARREGSKATEDEMVGWHHQLDGHEFVQVLGDSEGLGSLACCSQSMGSQRIRHNLATEQQQYQISKELNTLPSVLVSF